MMNLHKLGTDEAEAWPVIHRGPQATLDQIIIESRHPDGDGRIHLSRDQVLYVQSRLSLVAAGVLHGHRDLVTGLATDHLPGRGEHQMRNCGARVWPIARANDGQPPVLDEVVVESHHPDGDGLVYLSADQAGYIHSRLTRIALAFLHDDVWGGEDARHQ